LEKLFLRALCASARLSGQGILVAACRAAPSRLCVKSNNSLANPIQTWDIQIRQASLALKKCLPAIALATAGSLKK
jgi:hypothetical protein